MVPFRPVPFCPTVPFCPNIPCSILPQSLRLGKSHYVNYNIARCSIKWCENANKRCIIIFNHMQRFYYFICQSTWCQNASKLIYQKGEISFLWDTKNVVYCKFDFLAWRWTGRWQKSSGLENRPTPGMVFSCDQAALRMVQSVCLSVCPSVCLSVCLSVIPFWLCSHHRVIIKFSGVITNDRSDVHAKGQGHRSKVKVTEVTTQLNRFRTVTPVWIHIWWNDAYSLMLLRRGALLFFKVIRQIARSHGSKNHRIWPKFGVSGL